MKHWNIPAAGAVLFLALATGAFCGETWTVKLEGNGMVKGGNLSAYGVSETDLDWNINFNEDTGEVQGRVNLIEHLSGGGIRRLKGLFCLIAAIMKYASKALMARDGKSLFIFAARIILQRPTPYGTG